jgi:hypothetical protein
MGLFDWLFGKKPSEPSGRRTPAAGGSQGPWKAGDRVLASWLDGYFYPGRVRQVQGDSCAIAFDDGDVAWVHEANVRGPDIRPGSQVFCRFHAGPMYLPGTVQQQHGEKIHVRYESGEQEWTTISLVRVRRPLANPGAPPAVPHPSPGMPAGPALPGALPGGMGGPWTGTLTATGPMAGPPAGPFIPDVGEPLTDSKWRAGDRVLGRWYD